METAGLLRLREVADMLQVPAVTVRLWADKGLLQVSRTPGGHRRFSFADVHCFARAHGMALATPGNQSDQALRVLVVDDDPHWLELISQVIQQAEPRVRVATASDGFSAGRKTADFRPDVILLDIRMPGLDGLQVCRQIKAGSATARCRIIAMSDDASEAEACALVEGGAECCIRKPLNFEKLLSLLGLREPSLMLAGP